MTLAPPKARSDVEILVEQFTQWVNERISDLEYIPAEYAEKWRVVRQARIETLRFAQVNLERLAESIST